MSSYQVARADLRLPPSAPLPDGYGWGAHVDLFGGAGRWIVREADGAGVVAQLRPDFFVIVGEVEEGHGCEVTHGWTAAEVAAEVAAAFGRRDRRRRLARLAGVEVGADGEGAPLEEVAR